MPVPPYWSIRPTLIVFVVIPSYLLPRNWPCKSKCIMHLTIHLKSFYTPRYIPHSPMHHRVPFSIAYQHLAARLILGILIHNTSTICHSLEIEYIVKYTT